MSFTFGFEGDDVDDDESAGHLDTEGQKNLIEDIEKVHIADLPSSLMPPKSHTLSDLLGGLPSQISYNVLRVPGIKIDGTRGQDIVTDVDDTMQHEDISTSGDVNVARRSIFDIRTQLMVEADPEEKDDESLLNGLDRGDLSTGIYEGGFKTWECAVDLAGLVHEIELADGMHIIELGAGSAIPSMVLLQRALNYAQQQQHQSNRIHFTLCDYNEDVLRLATAPNIFLAQQVSLSHSNGQPSHSTENEIQDIDETKVAKSLDELGASSIKFDFVSGAWGEEFVKLVQSNSLQPQHDSKTLILASETIYSPESIKLFTQSLIDLLRRDPQNSKAWVAAKKIYFGVGGGVQDFESEVLKRGGCLRTLLDVQTAGVGRVVLEVTL